MAHSYTPGLKVLKKTIFKKERILPLKGEVLVKSGDSLNPETIVASTNLPGNCLLYTSPSPRDLSTSRMPSSA